MAKLKQGILTKKLAYKKINQNIKYKYTTTSTVSQIVNNSLSTKKYTYSKKVLANAKYKY